MDTTLTTSRPICQLPTELANQIAAGEVVERPASVVKELVENSLDAGATRIEVHISHGGLQSILIRDNGFGIPKNEIPLAISRHATSKIRNLVELENIQSLGFRGEALASIGSVSRMKLISREPDGDTAWQIDCASDDLSVQPVSHPQGSSIHVEDLFYNTPARRKFMRTEKTEFRHVDEVVRRMALSHFEVGFSFQHNERTVYQFPPANTDVARQRRVARLCGKAFMDHAVQVDFSARGLRLAGWMTGATFSRSQNDLQHFFVNGRIIRDRLITHAIRQVYQRMIPPGRHAAYVLHFEIDPGAVDVNVHPTKHEVRFREARMVHDFIHRSLRDALSDSAASSTEIDWPPSAYAQPAYAPSAVAESAPQHLSYSSQSLFLIENRFIVTEKANGLVIADAKGASEILVKKKLAQTADTKHDFSRPLLIPKRFSLSSEHTRLYEKRASVFELLGFDLSLAGPDSLLLRAIPMAIAGADMQAMLEAILAWLVDHEEAKVSSEDVSSIHHEMARVTASTRVLPSSAEDLNRLLQEIETLHEPSLWRCLNAQELARLLPKH